MTIQYNNSWNYYPGPVVIKQLFVPVHIHVALLWMDWYIQQLSETLMFQCLWGTKVLVQISTLF